MGGGFLLTPSSCAEQGAGPWRGGAHVPAGAGLRGARLSETPPLGREASPAPVSLWAPRWPVPKALSMCPPLPNPRSSQSSQRLTCFGVGEGDRLNYISSLRSAHLLACIDKQVWGLGLSSTSLPCLGISIFSNMSTYSRGIHLPSPPQDQVSDNYGQFLCSRTQ